MTHDYVCYTWSELKCASEAQMWLFKSKAAIIYFEECCKFQKSIFSATVLLLRDQLTSKCFVTDVIYCVLPPHGTW